ncbi:hypothetical protein A2781_07220 [Candidatus Gottesmanbacteria bacterium RIFCSPHIGHO2_01_FULL_42_27]|uniref:Uncharacterized protein n=1 Tax=Candidatus Gottesmanbacteria bacterium RIFCSPLOWO2_01_FULL_42_22 TaxID=1798391 RepID=A0A1F6BAF9_9BACT|nr:MAG: hypothetical protein A2781_07220 [Candidatus Gottesmanbacteria bacterium RIFCSPHIGHO2_01_FULL_42_27]OGG20488.1 MAG: hypothetical protein A3E72_02215 [Candidatus Gottesmanbacteria bacterium RIFCSPHIGHO2_12_FULL_43_26]OGG33489.1 MAG: hypothetical protein A3G68_03920 [Candidatus Gottesmanbacteria bacterium RIFCSPLOWO2_12_FULL_42_10]OGG33916.1 MAG: hypothetical protein A2968_07540 [Candidatus Gottesmanbacteria bacterium RIFCSPLOWO2_01_FULL_42_22]
MSRFFLICALIISSLIYSFPFAPPVSAKKAQYVANYIKVDHTHEQGFIFGAVVGTPEVSDRGVKAVIRIYNATDAWLGLHEVDHHAAVKPVVQTWGLIPPKSYKNYTAEFYLEDDFVSFIFDNWKTGGVTYFDHVFRTFGPGIIIDALEMVMSVPEVQGLDADKGWKLFWDIINKIIIDALNDPADRKNIRRKLVQIIQDNNIPLSVPTQNALQGNINKFLDDKLHFAKVEKRGFGKVLGRLMNAADGIKRAFFQYKTAVTMYKSYVMDGLNPTQVTFTAERLGNREADKNTPPPCQAHIEEDAKMETSWWNPEYVKLPEEIVCANPEKILPKGAAVTPQKANKPQSLEETQKVYEDYQKAVTAIIDHLKDETLVANSGQLEEQIAKSRQLSETAEQKLTALNAQLEKLTFQNTANLKDNLKNYIAVTDKLIDLEKDVSTLFTLMRDYYKAADRLNSQIVSMQSSGAAALTDVDSFMAGLKEIIEKEDKLIESLGQFNTGKELKLYVDMSISGLKKEKQLLTQAVAAVEKQDPQALASFWQQYPLFLEEYLKQLTSGMAEMNSIVESYTSSLTRLDEQIRSEYAGMRK